MQTRMIMDSNDVRKDIDVWDIDLENQIVVLKTDGFKEDYRDAKYQLVKCTGGFGCKPDARGNAIFVDELFDGGESYRIERYNKDIIGVATDEAIAQWKSIYCKELI